MKDLTSTSFGLIIAFILPGLAGLYALSFWSPRIGHLLEQFLTAQSNVGLFLLVVLVSLSVGLLVTVPRWLLYERWLCRKDELGKANIQAIGEEANRLESFREINDQFYRYHQFWGGMSVVMPFVFAGLLSDSLDSLAFRGLIFSGLSFLAVEAMTVYAAVVAYRNYVIGARRILKRN